MTFRPNRTEASMSFTGSSIRPLCIDFAFYTEGDAAFKKELCLMLIDNIVELRRSLTEALQQDDRKIFLDACHKATVTLSMLADKEFIEIMTQLKEGIVNMDKDRLCSNRFQDVCDLIIASLRSEINDSVN